MQKLNVKGLALGFGILLSLYVFLIGMASMLGWGTEFVEVFSSLYIGFGPSFLGSLIGAAWGFVDGVIGGAIIALIYNKIASG